MSSKYFCYTIGAILLSSGFIQAADKNAKVPAATPLNAQGEALHAKYAEQLKTLKAAITTALPIVSEQQKTTLQTAREALKKAEADAAAAKQNSGKLNEAKALVEHARGKWIGGADKGIAAAEAALKKAKTDTERAAAQKELEKWQANKADGQKALQERQATFDRVKLDEPRLAQANSAAQTALAKAQSAEKYAAQAILAVVEPFLASEALDAKLVPATVLAEATPRGLAEFAQQSKANEQLVERLLADQGLMKAMLEAGGAKQGKYGTAMQIYTDLLKVSARAQSGTFNRLALAISLEHAVPIAQRNSTSEKSGPPFVDPVQRFIHYGKAFLAGELDPAFPSLTTWECRMIVDGEAPDHVMAWGREMLRNYRPDHISNPDYGWRYSGAVRTDVAYRHSQEYQDDESLEFFQNVCKNGGICGRRAFFGRFIIQSFGLPVWGVTQHKHAAVGRWTPRGWVVNLGANWEHSWYEGRSGVDFLLETQARKLPQDFTRVLRAQWVATVLGEPRVDTIKRVGGGWWNTLAHDQMQVIAAAAKPAELAALGQDLGEANESVKNKATAIEKATVTEADKKIAIDPRGLITIPAAAIQGKNQLVKSYLGGQQMLAGGPFSCTIEVPSGGNYVLTARVVTVHDEQQIELTTNRDKQAMPLVIPYTLGRWQSTKPAQIALQPGKNVLEFSKPLAAFTLKDITLQPAK